jgi:hypothetical protein
MTQDMRRLMTENTVKVPRTARHDGKRVGHCERLLTIGARQNTKSTRFCSHQAINASRANPESARSRMRVFTAE